MADNLVEAFRQFNKGTLPVPNGLCQIGCYYFEVEAVLIKVDKAKMDEQSLFDVSKRLRRPWDVYVIDRLFGHSQGDRQKGEFKAVYFLESLRDLQVSGLRIVWTAFPDQTGFQNIIDCMRLGAWDYIDKNNPRHGDTFTDVVVSAVEGLQQREAWARQATVDQDGHQFVVDNYSEIYPAHKGNYVAFEKGAGGKWSIKPVAKAPSLFELYEILGENRGAFHITWVRE